MQRILMSLALAGVLAVAATAQAQLAVGKPAPEWKISDSRDLPAGTKLADLRGKWVVLEAWGFW